MNNKIIKHSHLTENIFNAISKVIPLQLFTYSWHFLCFIYINHTLWKKAESFISIFKVSFSSYIFILCWYIIIRRFTTAYCQVSNHPGFCTYTQSSICSQSLVFSEWAGFQTSGLHTKKLNQTIAIAAKEVYKTNFAVEQIYKISELYLQCTPLSLKKIFCLYQEAIFNFRNITEKVYMSNLSVSLLLTFLYL